MHSKYRHGGILGDQGTVLQIQRQVPAVDFLGIGLVGLFLIIVIDQCPGAVRHKQIPLVLHGAGSEIGQERDTCNLQTAVLQDLFTVYARDETVVLNPEKARNLKSLLGKLESQIDPIVPVFICISACLKRVRKAVDRIKIALVVHIGDIHKRLHPHLVLAESHRIFGGVFRIASPLPAPGFLLYLELHKRRFKIQFKRLILRGQLPAPGDILSRLRTPVHLFLDFLRGCPV